MEHIKNIFNRLKNWDRKNVVDFKNLCDELNSELAKLDRDKKAEFLDTFEQDLKIFDKKNIDKLCAKQFKNHPALEFSSVSAVDENGMALLNLGCDQIVHVDDCIDLIEQFQKSVSEKYVSGETY